MKKYSYIVFLVILCAFSWFFAVRSYKSGNVAFEGFMEAAEKAYEKKVYSEAEDNYKKAVLKRPKDEKALFGLASTYYAEEKYKDAADTCEKIRAEHPEIVEVAILEANSLISGGKYSKSLEILSQVEQTENVQEMIIGIKSKYTLRYFDIKNPQYFDVCAPHTPHLSCVFEKNHMSAYNSGGVRAAHGENSYLGGVSEDGTLFPAVSDGKWCFVDRDGKRKLVPDESFGYLGPICQGLIVAEQNGDFMYLDTAFSVKSDSYDAAYNFSDGKAAVLQDGRVKIVNTSFETVAETQFSGIESDEYGYTDHFGRSVLIEGDLRFLCDSSGAKISDFSAEYIGLPMESGGLVEFMSQNLYGFADSETGKIVISPKYEDACAFCRGLAPVKQGGKWGFIDEKGNEIVAPMFTFATPLSESGSAWVRNEAGFALLTFSFLAEEE